MAFSPVDYIYAAFIRIHPRRIVAFPVEETW